MGSKIKRYSFLFPALGAIGSIFAGITYVSQTLLGLGEMAAEAIPLTCLFTFLLWFGALHSKIHIRDLLPFVSLLFYVLALTVLTLVVAITDGGFGRLLFLYQYLLFIILAIVCLSPLEHLPCKPLSFVVAAFVTTMTIAAIFGLLQYFDLGGVPIDINRARGLSRSTLNFSSLILMAFVATYTFTNNFWSNGARYVLFAGAIASQGRGVLLAIIVFFLVQAFLSPNWKARITKVTSSVLISLIGLYLARNFFPETGPLSYLPDRLLHGLSLTTDAANSQRIVSYLKIFSEFNWYGAGAGSTGPAAARFHESGGFESYVLALWFHGGVFAFVFFGVFTFILVRIRHNILFLSTALAVATMATVQQTLETPSVFVSAVLVLIGSRIYGEREQQQYVG